MPKYEPKPYKLLKTDEDGREWREYENGDIRDQQGLLLVRPQRVIDAAITPETSALYKQKRKEKILQAIEKGVMKVTDAPDEYEAISRIVQRRAVVAMSDDGRAGNDAAKIVLSALDALQDKQQETIQTQRHVYEIDPETMAIIEQMVQMRREKTNG